MQQRIIQEADKICAGPIIKRAHSLDDIPTPFLDSRANPELGGRREVFTLSMSDFFVANKLVEALPLVAAAIPSSPLGYGGQAESWIDDPFPDYGTEPVMAYANG